MNSQRPVYLDCHATTPVDPRVLERMLPFFTEKFGNPSSISHSFGWEAEEAVETARSQVARLLNADPRSIVFTSGATEANNLALKGLVRRLPPPGAGAAVAEIEHRSILDPARRLKRMGYGLVKLSVNEFGEVDREQLESQLHHETRLVSIGWANNEIGTAQNMAAIAKQCKEGGVAFHTDAAQAVGKIPIDLSELPVDLMSFTAHKIYGPKGIGALYINPRSRVRLEPLLDGGGQERNLRSGTLAVPLIVGFGAACELAGELMEQESARLAELRDRLWQGLSAEISGIRLNGHPERRLPGNLNISIKGVDGDALMTNLKQIAVSSGSACTSSDPEPSHVLRAIGRDENLARSSLRFGLGRFTTAEEIDFAVQHVAEVVRRLRG